MHGPKGKQQPPHRKSNSQSKGRVIDLRAWKLNKRLQHRRSKQSWAPRTLFLFAAVLFAVTGLCALSSCIPYRLQVLSILLTWFLAVFGCGASISLNVLEDRRAYRLLGLYAVALAVSFVAALVKVAMLPR